MYDTGEETELNDRPDKGTFMKDLWNGMFDFNGDGRMDIGEEFLAYKIYEAVIEESEDNEEDLTDDEEDCPDGLY